MLSWPQAHRLAHIEATKARAKLDVDPAAGRVDVFQAIGRAGVALIWRHLPTVFGAYINEQGARPGILVNNGLPPAARRYTGGHELGHHWLKHTTSIDDDSTIVLTGDDQLDPIPTPRTPRVWTDQEKLAETFAAWFLMPPRAVRAGLGVLGLDRPASPTDVYRLSLLLGVPYRSLTRHLVNLRLAHVPITQHWGSVAPSKIKAGLDTAFQPPESRAGDVWLVTEGFCEITVELAVGDRLVIPGPGSGTDGVDWLRPVPPRGSTAGSQQCFEVTQSARTESCSVDIDSPDSTWSISLAQTPRPQGLQRPAR